MPTTCSQCGAVEERSFEELYQASAKQLEENPNAIPKDWWEGSQGCAICPACQNAAWGTDAILMALGAVAGIVVAFLPFGDPGLIVMDDWRGTVSLAGYLAALVLAFVLYPPSDLVHWREGETTYGQPFKALQGFDLLGVF